MKIDSVLLDLILDSPCEGFLAASLRPRRVKRGGHGGHIFEFLLCQRAKTKGKAKKRMSKEKRQKARKGRFC